MLNISNTLSAAIASYNVAPFILVELGFRADNGGTVYLADAYRDITHNGNTYLASAGLNQVQTPQAQADLNRGLFSISLADPTFVYRTRFLNQPKGVPMSVVTGFFDSDGNQLADTAGAFNGKVISASHRIDERGVAVTTVQATSPLSKFTQTQTRSTTANSQKRIHPSDTCFDRSFDTSNDTRKWGGRV